MVSQRIRTHVRVTGIVQGVGFRPFVYSLASGLGLGGLVGNDVDGVFAEVEGAPETVAAFMAALRTDAPPLASIEQIATTPLRPDGSTTFTIAPSQARGPRRTLVSADTATCEDCLAELADPADRRFGYAFINCTNCGPRFTIVTGVPYDRPLTTMAGFAMCALCAREYHDPANRRFHAQPTCCPACGPRLRLTSGTAPNVLLIRSRQRPNCSRQVACSRSRGWAAITWPPTRPASRRPRRCGRASTARTSRSR